MIRHVDLSKAFFLEAAIFGLGGMILGSIMGITDDYSLTPAHAHLNLLGWATLAIMGSYHGLAHTKGTMGWVNFGLSSLGALLMPLSFVLRANGYDADLGLKLGGSAALSGMLAFILVITMRGTK